MAVRPPTLDIIVRVLPFLARFLLRLAQIDIADLDSLRVTSWFRDPVDNRRARGLPDSQHLLGLGLDVGGSEIHRGLFASRARAVGLIALEFADHVHLQLLPAGTARGLGLFES